MPYRFLFKSSHSDPHPGELSYWGKTNKYPIQILRIYQDQAGQVSMKEPIHSNTSDHSNILMH